MEIKNFKIIGLIIFIILIMTAVVVSFLEPRSGREIVPEEPAIDLETDFSAIFSGQMGFVFYEDANANSEYDFSEKVFKDITVALRRPGEPQPFISVPAEANGLVKISNLPEGQYEVQYLNQALEQPLKQGDFIFRPYFQIIEERQVRYSFLPSEWQAVALGSGGYKAKIGLREYRPESLLVIMSGGGLKFYDPARAKILGQSDLVNNAGSKFDLRNRKIFYANAEDLKQFSLDNRSSATVIDGFLNLVEKDYELSPLGFGVIYPLDKQWHYQNDSLNCDTTVTGEDQQRLQLGLFPLADWLDDRQVVLLASAEESSPSVYLVSCDSGRLTAKDLYLTHSRSAFFLDKETVFYDDGQAAYFYNLATGQRTIYAALGEANFVRVSPDKKYISAKSGSSLIVVDWPAVKASGVEKHYLLPYSGQAAFFGDEILINQSKTCEADGDCGEILRLKLLGNGVWEIKDRIQLKDLAADFIVGEIKL